MDRRTHIVLVPGFAGFDALGQLDYYSNVTQSFHIWQAKRDREEPSERDPAAHATLHYFPGFPTAGVTTRARLLEAYLARRCARNEFQSDDVIVLVGHSTSGLDIRQLLSELTAHDTESVRVDGDTGRAWPVKCDHILKLVRRVVFVSVPQRGANIADHVGRNRYLAAWLVTALRLGFNVSQVRSAASLLKSSERWDGRLHSELLMAVRDALVEVAQRKTAGRFTAAQARAAHMQIKLWLSHIDADFLAIDDLKTQCENELKSVARFSDQERENELRCLDHYDILTRSYATIGRCPFDEACLRRGESPSWYDVLVPSAANPAGTELFYRMAYKLCTIGALGGDGDGRVRARVLGTDELRNIEPWENDGIVNTASMLWPDGENTKLVAADHADIIGHYRRAEDPSARWFERNDPLFEQRCCARKYHTYDIFGSNSSFGDREFQAVWEDILDFSVGGCRESSTSQ